MCLLLVACNGSGKADVGPYCEDTPTVVATDAITELGFSAEQILPWVVGTHESTLTWARDDTTTGLTVVIAEATEARFVRSEAVYPEDSTIDIGVVCDDRVEVDVPVGFTTADGAFAEALDAVVRAPSSEEVSMWHELDPDGLTGTYDMDDDITETGWDDRSMWVSAVFTATGVAGQVGGQVSGEDECDGDTCSAWASEVPIASWAE